MIRFITRRHGVALALLGAAACVDTPAPTTSLAASSATEARATSGTTDENYVVSPVLGQLNVRLAAAGAPYRVLKADLRIAAIGWEGVTSTVLIANDRSRGIGAEWVNGDPRRGGRVGVTYAFGSNTAIAPTTRDPNGANVRLVTAAEQTAKIEEAMSAWRGVGCSAKPITSVPVPAGTDPDYLDQYFAGIPQGSANYAQPADIVQSGWQPAAFFTTIAGGPVGNNIIGITFSLGFTDNSGNFTDIDRDGKVDLALSEIFYNDRFYWGDGAANVVDFYSILAHETGHALGLAHFGKVFVTKTDAADGLQISDIKYAPYALMNAVYVTGRNEIVGSDVSQFCQIWSSF
jgi:hypothetical protein